MWVAQYVFKINLMPRPKGRPRVTKKGFTYTPPETRKAEQDIVAIISSQVESMLYGPIKIQFVVTLPRPKSHFRTGKYEGIMKDTAPFHHIKRPDLDNLEKLFLDAANGVVYKDDSQVCQKTSQKIYGEVPGYSIEVYEWKG